MSALLLFEIDEDCTIAVEVDSDSPGFRPASHDGRIALATKSFSAAIEHARRAAEVALRQFTSMIHGPEEIELEFGIRLSAETGAVLAKAATEGNINVRLTWRAPAG